MHIAIGGSAAGKEARDEVFFKESAIADAKEATMTGCLVFSRHVLRGVVPSETEKAVKRPTR